VKETIFQEQQSRPIGVFDSGRGGWYTMQEIRTILPEYDYLFFGDTANMPYGDKTPHQIEQYTFQALEWLFSHGCQIVIIACNTASAYAIRKWQEIYSNRKVLSVTIPGIEALVSSGQKNTLFLSTKATEESGILADLAYKNNYEWSLSIKSCPWLADRIEEDTLMPYTDEEKRKIIADYVGDVSGYDSMVLACTHYGVRYDVFVELYPSLTIIDPSQACASALQDYLQRHKEIETLLTRWGWVQEHRTKK
jgi:glutamate racemase